MDDDGFRHPWEDEAPRVSSLRDRPVASGSDALLIPLARAQDAVARLALFEAAGCLGPSGAARASARPGPP